LWSFDLRLENSKSFIVEFFWNHKLPTMHAEIWKILTEYHRKIFCLERCGESFGFRGRMGLFNFEVAVGRNFYTSKMARYQLFAID